MEKFLQGFFLAADELPDKTEMYEKILYSTNVKKKITVLKYKLWFTNEKVVVFFRGTNCPNTRIHQDIGDTSYHNMYRFVHMDTLGIIISNKWETLVEPET